MEELALHTRFICRIGFELQDDFTDEDLKKYELNAPRVIVVGLTSAGEKALLRSFDMTWFSQAKAHCWSE